MLKKYKILTKKCNFFFPAAGVRPLPAPPFLQENYILAKI